MEAFRIEDLSFFYPDERIPALQNVSLSVKAGEFMTLCGASGSGKTTLLRMLKPALAPAGEKSGEIYLNGEALSSLSPRV